MTEVVPGARPDELVPGRPEDVERLAARMARFATSSGDAAARLETIDDRAWSGEAGRMFREAVGPVPARLGAAAAAFAAAARALSAYASALRDGQAAATRAVRLVEQSTPESAEADRQTATSWLARARTNVEEAGRVAAMRLGEATADAPEAEGELGGTAFTSNGVTVELVTRHELTDPDHYVSGPGHWADSVADVRYTEPHDVGFADPGPGGEAGGGGAGEAAWRAWAAEGTGRALGVVEPALLAAFGVAALGGLTVIGRRRRESTALSLVNLDEGELRARRDELGGARERGGVLARADAGRRRGSGAWRTRLASPPRPGGTVQHWTGPVGGPEPRLRAAGEPLGSVDRAVRGAVLRTGRPAHEG
ncbi:MAG TPA: hypothetical protein VF109_08900 [Mycobacteriales bacterium]